MYNGYPEHNNKKNNNKLHAMSPQQYEERREIRRMGNAVGVAFLIMNLVIFAVRYAIIFVYELFPLSQVSGYELFSEPGFIWTFQIAFSFLGFTIPFIMSAKIMKLRVGKIFAAKKISANSLFSYALLGFGAAGAANILTSIFYGFSSSMGILPQSINIENPDGILGFIIVFLGTACLPALCEEFALRGIVLGALRTRFSDSVAIVISAAVFGIMHGNLVQIPFAFIMGLCLAFITVKTNSIWPAVLAHFAVNSISILADYLPNYLDYGVFTLVSNMFLIIMLVSFVVGAALVLRKNSNAFKLKDNSNATGQKQLIKWFFTSPAMIIYTIFIVVEIILVQIG